MTDPTASGPYGRAAQDYRRAGWLGTLPIGNRAGTKYPPPQGFTGHGAPMPSAADVGAWLETHADRNIGLRLPPGVIGLDVDNYAKDGAAKSGGATLAALEARFGPLPPTWITSARTDGVSGIRFFRVPTHNASGAEINWPGEAGPNIEIIQTGHRYALAWPSTNPEAGDDGYFWRWDHAASDNAWQIPDPASVPDLPEAWVEGLRLTYERAEKGDLGNREAQEWWAGLGHGEPCRAVTAVRDRAHVSIRAEAGSRHETARDAIRALVAFGAEGHAGAPTAVDLLRNIFDDAVGTQRAASGEFDRLLLGAVQLAAAKHPQPAAVDPCATPVPKALPEGFVIPNPPAPAAVTAAVPTPPAGALTLPAEFWAARPSLAAIRQAAHHKVRSADVVFYGVLVRLAALAPHEIRADTGVGTPASLNTFAAIVGPSGAGKSSGISVARLVVPAADLEEVPLGSGEGLAESFMGMTSIDDPNGAMTKDGSPKRIRQKAQVRHNVLVHADEGASLNKMLERTGSTVGEALRSAWSGETIGQKNGREETTRVVHGGQYAMGLLIGYQPSTVLPLLADVDAGTPQRFLYGWAVDPTIPTREHKVSWPGETPNPFPPDVATVDIAPNPAPFTQPAGCNVTPISFAPEIRDELYDVEHAKASGTLPRDHPLHEDHPDNRGYRSQHTVLKVKVASLLALLDGGRRRVEAEDWRLAQIVLDTSDAVRSHLQAVSRAREEARRQAEELVHVRRAVSTHEAVSSAADAAVTSAVHRVALRLASKVRDGGELVKRAAARKMIAARDREHFDEAAELAVAKGWLAGDAEAGWKPGEPLP
jgi:hypothetical protein